MARREFPKAIKLSAWRRCCGQCESCTTRLYPGRFEYHHDKEDTFDGEPTLANCKVLCIPCHNKITRQRASVIAKSTRIRANHLGIKSKPKGRPMPGTRASGLRKRMDGTVERRSAGSMSAAERQE